MHVLTDDQIKAQFNRYAKQVEKEVADSGYSDSRLARAKVFETIARRTIPSSFEYVIHHTTDGGCILALISYNPFNGTEDVY